MAAMHSAAACISKPGTLHIDAANDLFDSNVWIGCLQKHNTSYRGLPSFADLKANCRRFNGPSPVPTNGKPGEERYGVCRGCFGAGSRLITLRELAYAPKTKLLIMPLKNDLFCILLPLPTGRSLNGVQAYCPYEIANDGKFKNNFQILTLRNSSQATGTMHTIRAALGAIDPEEPSSRRQPPSLSRAISDSSDTAQNTPEPAQKSSKRKRGHDKRPIRRLRSPTPPETILTTSGPEDPGAESQSVGRHPTSRGTYSSGPVDLTGEQAKRVRVIYIVKVDKIKNVYVHTMDESNTFSGLVDLFRGDAEGDPQTSKALNEAKRWRLTYELATEEKIAITLASDNQAAFGLFRETLAESVVLEGDAAARLDVELKPLGTN